MSADVVYGDSPLDRPDLLFTEQTPLHPSRLYSASKAAADVSRIIGRTIYPLRFHGVPTIMVPTSFPES